MTSIRRIFFAMLTRSSSNAETDSAINLVITQQGSDVVNHRYGDTFQRDQERGQANFYEFDVGPGIDTSELDNESVRVGILGDDAWAPEVLFLWARARDNSAAFEGVIPLAIETDVNDILSTNDAGAVPSLPVRLVGVGDANMEIRRLLLVLLTEGNAVNENIESSDGTNDHIQLQIVANNQLVIQQVIYDTPQDDLQPFQANLYWISVPVPFTRASMDNFGVRLSITGQDSWLPSHVFLFGLDMPSVRPDRMIPLVFVDGTWPYGPLSTNSDVGVPEVILPLLLPPQSEAIPELGPSKPSEGTREI